MFSACRVGLAVFYCSFLRRDKIPLIWKLTLHPLLVKYTTQVYSYWESYLLSHSSWWNKNSKTRGVKNQALKQGAFSLEEKTDNKKKWEK